MAHAKLHVICGNCGGTDFTFSIDPTGHDITDEVEEYEVAVFIKCLNCSTLHDLSDNAKLKEKAKPG